MSGVPSHNGVMLGERIALTSEDTEIWLLLQANWARATGEFDLVDTAIKRDEHDWYLMLYLQINPNQQAYRIPLRA